MRLCASCSASRLKYDHPSPPPPSATAPRLWHTSGRPHVCCHACVPLVQAFEQWKRLVDVCCRCTAILQGTGAGGEATEFAPFLRNVFQAVTHQLEEMPADFFDNALSKENFLRKSLQELVVAVDPAYVDAEDGATVEDGVRAAVAALVKLCSRRFRWHLSAGQVMPDDDDMPVVVDTNASMY